MFDRPHAPFTEGAPSISGALLVLSLLTMPSVASAQELRATQIAEAQSEKAKDLEPYEPSRAEEVVIRVKNTLLSNPSGVYPLFGSVYSGGGMALGAGVRQYYGDNTYWDVKGLYSIRGYKWLEASTDSLGLGRGKLDLHVSAGWRDITQAAFYGIGIGTSTDDRANFGLEQTYIAIEANARPTKVLVLGGATGYERYNSKEGTGKQPSIEEVFTSPAVSGLGVDPTFIHSRGLAGIDWRPASGYARSGGLYTVQYHDYRDRDERFSFNRVEGELVQHLPLMREKFILSLRGRVETILDDDDEVPYFMLPSLGSGSTLRGFSSWRFRDRHSLLLQAEWRWTPSRTGLDFAFFYDAGKVANRRADLDFEELKSDFGVGARFHGPVSTPLRLEVARSNEGIRLVFGGSAAF